MMYDCTCYIGLLSKCIFACIIVFMTIVGACFKGMTDSQLQLLKRYDRLTTITKCRAHCSNFIDRDSVFISHDKVNGDCGL